MAMLHADQFFYMAGLSNDETARKYVLACEFARDGVCLDEMTQREWEDALPQIDAQGTNAYRKLCTGDFFHHPRCAKCERCRRHRPECYYDRQIGVEALVCDRCQDAMTAKEAA